MVGYSEKHIPTKYITIIKAEGVGTEPNLLANFQARKYTSMVCYIGSLSALVYQHSLMPLALPCKLSLPESDTRLSSEPANSVSTAQLLLAQGAGELQENLSEVLII